MMTRPPRRLNSREDQGRRGSVLVYVVWAVILLSLFATSVSSRALFALNLAERLAGQRQASYIAQAAIPAAGVVLAQDLSPMVDGANELWAHDPHRFHDYPMGGGTLRVTPEPIGEDGGARRYGMADEDQRVNLNTAPAEVLERLLEDVGGLRPREAAEAAASIEDWRDPDDDQRPSGAENFYYRSLRDGYQCKDGPLENAEELLLVKGVSPEVYARVAPLVTVYGSGRVNLNTAPRPVLRALGLSDAGVEGLTAFRAGEDNQEQTSDDRTLLSLGGLQSELERFVPIEDIAKLNTLAGAGFLGVGSEAFRMFIAAEAGRPQYQVHAMAVIRRQGQVQMWAER